MLRMFHLVPIRRFLLSFSNSTVPAKWWRQVINLSSADAFCGTNFPARKPKKKYFFPCFYFPEGFPFSKAWPKRETVIFHRRKFPNNWFEFMVDNIGKKLTGRWRMDNKLTFIGFLLTRMETRHVTLKTVNDLVTFCNRETWNHFSASTSFISTK